MRIRIVRCLTCIAPALALAGCAPTLRPLVRQSAALPDGPRTIALAPSPPEVGPAFTPDRAAIEQALRQARFDPRPAAADARYILVITVAGGPRRVGSLVPPAEGAAAAPVEWIARPPRGLGASFGAPAAIRIGAIVIEGASGRELWRGTLSAPRGNRPDQVTSLAVRVLAELPRDQPVGGS